MTHYSHITLTSHCTPLHPGAAAGLTVQQGDTIQFEGGLCTCYYGSCYYASAGRAESY
jgi:hypothetical protein